MNVGKIEFAPDYRSARTSHGPLGRLSLDKPAKNWDSVARRYVERTDDEAVAIESFGPGGLVGGKHRPLPRMTRADFDAAPVFIGIDHSAPGGDKTAYWSPPSNDNRRGDSMQTYTARQFWPLDARTAEVHIEDIAHSLSLQCRYAGHCLRFYSVAEHCVHVARWIWWHSTPMNALIGLLHDATEAYLVDMPRPVKRSLHEYRLHEATLWKVIAARYGLPEEIPDIVHEADNRIIADELVNMHPMAWHAKHNDPLGVRLEFWSPERAEREFLDLFRSLWKEAAA